MTQYLTPRQRQLFIDRLAEENDAPQLSGDQRRAALQQGVDMARADMQGLPDEEGFFSEESFSPEEDVQAENGAMDERLAALGFESAEELADAYERLERRYADLMDDVRRIEAAGRARRNERRLENDPNGRNRVIQAVWASRAEELEDIAQFLPEMSAYIAGHPEYAMETDGLERAYDAVRSHRYRSEERLLDDPEAVKRLSADPRVREAVLSAHLAGIYKSAAALPAFIDDGGNIPVAEPNKGGMDRAKAKLTAMLAGNAR